MLQLKAKLNPRCERRELMSWGAKPQILGCKQQPPGMQNPKTGWLQTSKPQDANPQSLGCKTPSPLVANPMLQGVNP